ncbi:multidrug efflux pump subunit AcrB [Arthrobacter sp. UYCu511]|uniref:hypothetical protein n=1 Tax=Arthrobacter sp. UYCu511 TaxID=3156337 RepID=UPI0033956408
MGDTPFQANSTRKTSGETMTNNGSQAKSTSNSARYMGLGFAMGMLCMIALFVAGLIKANAGMVVMAASMAAVLGATWGSTVVAMKKKAAKENAAA